jgi:predicted S18 family serine protease
MAKSNIENIANMTDEVLEGLKEHNQEALEAIGIPWNDAISNAIEDFDKIKDEAADTSAELVANAADFGDFISGDEGIGAVTGEQYGQAKEAIDSAKDATEGLKKETEELNKALTQELGATSAAEEKIAEYEAQLTKAKESSSALSQKLQSTQQSLVNAKEEQKKSQMAYQTASEESAAMKRMSSGKFQKGDEFYLDKGTVVYYGRGAGQTDSKGRNSYKLPRKTKVVVQNPKQEKLDGSGQLAEHHVGFYAVNGQGYPQMIPDQDNPSTREGEQWHLSPELIRANLSFDTGGYTGE